MRPRTSSTATRVVTSCPSICARRRGGRKALAEAKRELELERETEQRAAEAPTEDSVRAIEAVVRAGGHQGRVGWLREGRRELEQRRAGEPEAIARSRVERLALGERRLAEELETDRRSE